MWLKFCTASHVADRISKVRDHDGVKSIFAKGVYLQRNLPPEMERKVEAKREDLGIPRLVVVECSGNFIMSIFRPFFYDRLAVGANTTETSLGSIAVSISMASMGCHFKLEHESVRLTAWFGRPYPNINDCRNRHLAAHNNLDAKAPRRSNSFHEHVFEANSGGRVTISPYGVDRIGTWVTITPYGVDRIGTFRFVIHPSWEPCCSSFILSKIRAYAKRIGSCIHIS